MNKTKRLIEGRRKVMLALWICPVPESIILKLMNCKIHLILSLTGTLKVHFLNNCVWYYLTLVSLASLCCFSLTPWISTFQNTRSFPTPARAANFLENSYEGKYEQDENQQENCSTQWRAVGNRVQTSGKCLSSSSSSQISKVYPSHIFAPDNQILED